MSLPDKFEPDVLSKNYFYVAILSIDYDVVPTEAFYVRKLRNLQTATLMAKLDDSAFSHCSYAEFLEYRLAFLANRETE